MLKTRCKPQKHQLVAKEGHPQELLCTHQHPTASHGFFTCSFTVAHGESNFFFIRLQTSHATTKLKVYRLFWLDTKNGGSPLGGKGIPRGCFLFHQFVRLVTVQPI